jgi:hypothetical protein
VLNVTTVRLPITPAEDAQGVDLGERQDGELFVLHSEAVEGGAVKAEGLLGLGGRSRTGGRSLGVGTKRALCA